MEPFGEFEGLLNSLTFGAGDGWKLNDTSQVFAGQATATSHQPYTWLDITGKGVLTCIQFYLGGSSSQYVTIQIDGGNIYYLEWYNYPNMVVPLLRFNTGLKVCANVASSGRAYALAVTGDDPKWSELTPVTSKTVAAHYAYTGLNISGASGVMTGISFVGSGHNVAVEVDNNGTKLHLASSGQPTGGVFIPFRSALKVTTDYSEVGGYMFQCQYFLD